jgi:hypothetical protein
LVTRSTPPGIARAPLAARGRGHLPSNARHQVIKLKDIMVRSRQPRQNAYGFKRGAAAISVTPLARVA